MAALTPVVIKGPFETIGANGADFTFAAGSVSTDSFACTGKEVILVFNSGGSPYTFTVVSVPDEKNRSLDEAYTLGAGEYAAFGHGLTVKLGWRQSGGTVITDVENAAVKIAILTLPADTLR